MRKQHLYCTGILVTLLIAGAVSAEPGPSYPTQIPIGFDIKSDVPSPVITWVPETDIKTGNEVVETERKLGTVTVTLNGAAATGASRDLLIGENCTGKGDATIRFRTETMSYEEGEADIVSQLIYASGSGSGFEEVTSPAPGFKGYSHKNTTAEIENTATAVFHIKTIPYASGAHAGGVAGHYESTICAMQFIG